MREDEQNPQNTENACADQHDDERRERLADAAHRPAENLHETMCEIEHEHDAHALHAPIDDHRILREQQHQLRTEIQRRQRHCHDDHFGHAKAIVDEFLHPRKCLSAIQLARKTDGRVVEGAGA